jgi:nicotinate-nucleotide pyrophosphorylase (carboxylating)
MLSENLPSTYAAKGANASDRPGPARRVRGCNILSPPMPPPLPEETLDAALSAFLREDVGAADVTTDATVADSARAKGVLVTRSECVVSGLPFAHRVFALLDPSVEWTGEAAAGSRAAAGQTLARISGKARAVLTGERVALNVVQRMCGIATMTRRYVDAVSGTRCRILDTRKTAPGLRAFDRQAVRDGGGDNHRNTLADLVLIKDNHRALAGGAAAAVEAARRAAPAGTPIEVEVESEEELREALAAGARRLLIDNQDPATVRKWTGLARSLASDVWIEASGGITLANVRDYALAGPDAVSIGALTHSVSAADVSLELEALA